MKAVRVLSRIVRAAIAGLCVRIARRVRRLPPRIWHGPSPLHSTSGNVLSDRYAGYPSRSVAMHASTLSYGLLKESEFDLVLDQVDVAWDEKVWNALADLLRHGDIWSGYFDGLFFDRAGWRRNALVFRFLRLLGIRIVVMPHGSDIVQLMPEKSRYDWIGLFQRDYPDWDFVAQTPLSRERLALFSRFADFVIAADSATRRLMPRYDALFKYYPIDTERLRPSPPVRRDVPLIIHAPNHRLVKGTDCLLAALDRLRAAGFTFELRLVERVPREEALQLYRDADIIADQFRIGAWGVFAQETLSLGKPVLVYLDEEHLSDPVFNLPLVNTTEENMTRVIAALVSVPELRERVGAAGRVAIERYQSVPALAEVWDRIYRHIWWGESLRLEETAMFSPERKPRSLSEDPAAEEFWPVPVGDLMPRIREAISRVS